MLHRVTAEIDLSALAHNVSQIKQVAANRKILAMVKGNAYGHGLASVARALVEKVDAFGVIGVDDVLCLAQEGVVTKPIVILSGFGTSDELRFFARHSCEVVVHNFSQINIIKNSRLLNKVKVWLKIDTGMHRLGFSPAEALVAYQQLVGLDSVASPMKLMTHFSDADDKYNIKTINQINAFNDIVNVMDGEKSAANSAAIFNFAQSHFDWVRPGIALYGVSPLRDKTATDLNLRPVMTLKSRIIAIHTLNKNASVGYGSSWSCPEEMLIGIAMIGYGDGYPFALGSSTPVLVNDVRCQLIGRVAMDLINIDLRNCPQAQVGDEVVLWGESLPLEEVTKNCYPNRYEFLTRLTARVFYQDKK